jgi:hypothetical protein
MKLAAILGITVAAAGAQTPGVGEIMARVGRNQSASQEARKQFTYHQHQLLRMTRGGGKLAREEQRDYDVSPSPSGFQKTLAHFEGKYESKGEFVSYDEPGYEYKEIDIDGELINEMSQEMTDDHSTRDGLGQDLFPLTESEQSKYNFRLLGKQQFQGREVYRVKFEPKPHQQVEGGAWKGEALIDAVEFQPVRVQTALATRIPLGVKILLGTDIKGLGFAVTYQRFEDGIWFPVSYGGEFGVRAVFFYKRNISVNLTNTEFRRTQVDSHVTYAQEK